MPFGINQLTGRPGPSPHPPRDGDKRQARQRINVEVRNGQRPHPNKLPCADCGHLWTKNGDSRHEYDHFKGYGASNHLIVEVVCRKCHTKRDNLKAKQTHCSRGHEFSPSNTYIKKNGTRSCRECMTLWDRARSPRGSDHWRKVNAKRKDKNYGK